MKNNIKKAECMLLSAVVLVFMLVTALPVFAVQNNIDMSKRGAIGITLKHNNESVSGAEFTVYKVADAGNKNEKVVFNYTADFKGFSQSTDSLSESDSPEKLVNFIESKGIKGLCAGTDNKGYVVFSNLDLGLYLVTQTKSVVGYSDCSSFIVHIPYYEDGRYKYTVDATPKTNIIPATSETTTKHDSSNIGTGNNNTTHFYTDKEHTTSKVSTTGNNFTTNRTSTVIINDGDDGEDLTTGSDDSTSSDDGDELYKTGQNRFLVPVIAFAGVFLLLLGCIISYSDRNKENG